MRNNRERLIRLMRALNVIDDQYYRMQRSFDMKESLFILLYACMDDKPRTQKDICEEWFIPRSTLNTTVQEQIEAGYIELIPRGDKQKLINLTACGRAYAESLFGGLLDAEDRLGTAYVADETIESLELLGEKMKCEFSILIESGDCRSAERAHAYAETRSR